jgi:signal transduction histidine kinase
MTTEPARAGVDFGAGAVPLLRAVTWLVRSVAFVVVCVIALTARGSHHAAVDAALAAIGVLLAVWGGIDLAAKRGHRSPTWLLMLVLAGMGTAGGLVSALRVGETAVAFAIMAAIGAGSDLPISSACGVGATSILAIEVSSLAFGFNAGDVGWPLAVVAGLLVGRNRRDARVKSAQATALIAQGERTRQQEQRAATLDERARIARDIHDLLAHSLGALGIQLEAAQAVLIDARDIDRAVPLLDQARRLAASGLEETRQAIEALRTDTPPLPESLKSLVEGHIEQHRTTVDLSVVGAAHALSPDANLALIRTAHEALANAAKHAPSAPIAISLDYGPHETTMTVTNSSHPEQDLATASSASALGANGGYGLAGMRERLLLIGGTLTAGQSDPGWTVRAEVPQ